MSFGIVSILTDLLLRLAPIAQCDSKTIHCVSLRAQEVSYEDIFCLYEEAPRHFYGQRVRNHREGNRRNIHHMYPCRRWISKKNNPSRKTHTHRAVVKPLMQQQS